MAARRAKTSRIEDAIGHRFANRSLLVRALTHVSAVAGNGGRGKSYQRLEFLGDHVLGLVIAELLYAAFPEAAEGELSRRLAELVRKDTCADVGTAWGIAAHVRVAQGPAAVIAAGNRAIIADVCEAIVGAVFVDAGNSAVRGVNEKAFGPKLHAPGAGSMRDAKTSLQEWAQGRGLPPPTYAIVDRRGPDHAPLFRIAVTVQGLTAADASGASRRLAEQAAAERLLRREGVWTDAPRE